jgi:putative hydrolase
MMINLTGDYHTHTIYSSGFKKKGNHAKGTIEENVAEAYAKGLDTIVISEHGPGHYLYGLKVENIPVMKKEIERLREIYEPKGLRILLGLEANLVGIDGELDVDDKIMKELDILLMGYHYGATPASFRDAFGLYFSPQLARLFASTMERTKERMTEAFIKAMDRYPINIITHPGSKARVDIVQVAKKAAEVGSALEISSKHDQLSVESLKLIKDIPVMLYLNSDAHEPSKVGDMDKGIERVKASGVNLDRIVNIKHETVK